MAEGRASLSAKQRKDAEKKLKAELWAPLWSESTRFAEIRRLFAEGRISWDGRQAATGADAVRSIRTLGADAGIEAFQRFALEVRMGTNPLAVPAGRFRVDNRSSVAVTAQANGWSNLVSRAARASGAPSSLVAAATGIERATFAARSGSPEDLQDLLVAVADAEVVVGRTEHSRSDESIPPVPWLRTRDWLPVLDDGTPELRLAASLAVARDPDVAEGSLAAGTLRTLLRPMAAVSRGRNRFAQLDWTRAEATVEGFGGRPLTAVLADALVSRSEAQRHEQPPASDGRADTTGTCQPWFPVFWPAGSGDAELLAAGQVDVNRLERLLRALLLLEPDGPLRGFSWRDHSTPVATPVPAWRLLAPFYARARPAPSVADGDPLRPRTRWARRLVNGDVEGVVADALVRWKLAGLVPRFSRASAGAIAHGVDPRCLGAALLTCPTLSDIRSAVAAVTGPLDLEPSQGDPS